MKYSDQFIDDYLLGRLTGSQLEQLEKDLQTDQTLVLQVKDRKVVLGVVDAFGDIEMMEQINTIHEKEMAKLHSPGRFKLFYIAAAAVVALLLAMWFLTRPASPEKLFAEYYKAYELSFTARDEANSQQLAQADRLYKSGDFQKALPLFEERYANDSTTSSKIGMAIGICKIETGQYEEALPYFTEILNQKFNTYKDQAIWYVALIKLKQGEPASARLFLQQLISNPKSYFYQEAKAILLEL